MSETIIALGRCPQTNDLQVEDASVSRTHLRLCVTSLQHIEVRDCQSSYGSYYWDGSEWQKFDAIVLTANDYIVIGKTKLRLMEIMIAYQIKSRSRGL